MELKNVIVKRDYKTVYDLGDRVVKHFTPDHAKSDVFNEALNNARVEETGLNIPKVLSVTNIDGGFAIEIEKKQGKTLEELIKENPDKLQEYMEKFVEIQMDVHSRRSPLLTKVKAKYNRIIADLDMISKDSKYELMVRLNSMKDHVKLLHGDFNPSNIIIAEDGSYSVIDWAHATQGNASSDAAMTYLLLSFESEEKAELYIEEFCKQSGISRRLVNLWLPIVAAVRLAKAKEDEKEKLLKWVDVFDFA